MREIEVPDIPLRQIVQWTLAVLAVVCFFALLLNYLNLVLLLLAAVILSTALGPLLRRLEQHGISKTTSLALILGVLLIVIALFLGLALPDLTTQSVAITGTLNDGYTLLLAELRQLPNIIVQRALAGLPPDLATFVQASNEVNGADTEANAADIMQQARVLLQMVIPLLAVILFTIYWSLSGERIRQAVLLLVPIEKRGGIRALLEEIDTKLGHYLAGQATLSLSIGILALIAYSLIGLPNALALAVFAGLMEAVPYIGPFIGAIPAVLIALTISPTAALWVVVATVIFQQLENNLLVPRVMRRAIGVSPLVSLLALIGFGSLFGVVGALIALPLAAVIQLVLDRTVWARHASPIEEAGRDRLSILRYETNQLVGDVRHYLRQKADMPSSHNDALEDEIEAIAADLENYLIIQQQEPA